MEVCVERLCVSVVVVGGGVRENDLTTQYGAVSCSVHYSFDWLQ